MVHRSAYRSVRDKEQCNFQVSKTKMAKRTQDCNENVAAVWQQRFEESVLYVNICHELDSAEVKAGWLYMPCVKMAQLCSKHSTYVIFSWSLEAVRTEPSRAHPNHRKLARRNVLGQSTKSFVFCSLSLTVLRVDAWPALHSVRLH